MQVPLEVAFVDMEPSPAVEARVRERARRLERHFDGITSCRVQVAAPHRHHRKGKHFEVRLEVRVPGSELTITGKPGDVNAHEDVYVAVRDAFDAMERQLEGWKQKIRGETKAHEPPLQGRVAEIFPDEGYGRIATTAGGLVYFHRNSVVGGAFEALAKGSPVELVVQYGEGEKGPQASTVRPIGTLQFVDQPK